ncbi:uncharacterized protein LOC143282342 [Babylonia areolata]|uniref:uncharacterized protein LOC143282342 n=1 Tax=Babylonia areolata TaxID=304850 RepID=UPI003FD1B6FA
MVSDKNQTKASHIVSDTDVARKFNLLRKYIQNCNGRIHRLKKRLHSVSREVKALKKERESHMKTVKKAERIERRLDAEKSKLKRKVLKSGKLTKQRKEIRKDNTSTASV